MSTGVIVIGEAEGIHRRERVSLFKQGGFTVLTADSARLLLDLLTRVMPRILMVDAGLNDLAPRDVCRRARNLAGPHTPILVIAEDTSSEHLAELLAHGANDFVGRREPPAALLTRIAVWANRIAATQKIRQQAAQLSPREPAGPRTGAMGEMPPELVAAPSRTAVIAFVRTVLEKARQMAESEFGRTTEEKQAFLGYIVGMIEAATEGDLRFRLTYREDLARLLKPTGALNDQEFQKIVAEWAVTVGTDAFQRGVDSGAQDVRQHAVDPKWPPMGLTDLIQPANGRRSW